MGRGLVSIQYICIIIIGIFVLSSFISAAPGNVSGSYNDTTITQVNVTSAAPIITSITIPDPITLNPGNITEVNCTVEVTEYNGWQTIKWVNATFWDNNSATMDSPDLNITHYTNTNCTQVATADPYNATYHCTFNISFYAYNSTEWICNATVLDNSTFNFTDTEFNITSINPLYALDVTPLIDFGDVTLGQFVTNKTANVTNFGNQAINISVQGYGQSMGDGLALFCPIQGNITIANLMFSSTGLPGKTPMTGLQQNVSGLTLPRINQGAVQPGTWYNTWWDLNVAPTNNPFGLCTGTVIFTAWNS